MSKRTVDLMQACVPVFTLLQDQRRLEILNLLFDHGEQSVTDLANQLVLSRPAVSHHLKLLLDHQLVSVEQRGKERYYSVTLGPALSLLKQLVNSLEKDIA
jgi:DNA-binding transcriptional ArsR family regulator